MGSIVIGRCGINDEKPQICKDYPKLGEHLPASCTYTFVGGERQGECHPEECQEDNCCATPREGGEPGGTTTPLGEPCKHLVWEEREEVEKTASEGRETENVARDVFSAGELALTGGDE